MKRLCDLRVFLALAAAVLLWINTAAPAALSAAPRNVQELMDGLGLTGGTQYMLGGGVSIPCQGYVYGHAAPPVPTAPAVVYRVSYHANGGTGRFQSGGHPFGATHTVLSAQQAGIGFEERSFVAWNTKSDGSGAAYPPGGPLLLTVDITLYAQWDRLSTQIPVPPEIYEPGDGSGEEPDGPGGEPGGEPENPYDPDGGASDSLPRMPYTGGFLFWPALVLSGAVFVAAGILVKRSAER